MLQIMRPTSRDGRALDRKGLVSLAACLGLMLCIGGASLWQAVANSRAVAIAATTRQQRNHVAALLLASEEAESSQRGYLLTGDAETLAPFDQAAGEMPAILSALAHDRPGDPATIAMGQAATAEFAELARTIRLARTGDRAAALLAVQTHAGRLYLTQMRKDVAALEASLDARVASRLAAVIQGGRLLLAIDVAGILMILALAGLIGVGLRRTVTTLRLAQSRTAAANGTLERSNERLDDTVRLRTAALTDANDEIQRFAYIVSHDLRAPLVNIMGFTSELEQAAKVFAGYLATAANVPAAVREVSDEDIPEALRFIRSSTTKMDRLINAILRLSREGRRTLSPEPLDMAAVLQAIVDSMQHQVSSRHASVTIGPMPTLVADRLAVEQVFSNVLENALKYLKPGRPGQIGVTGCHTFDMARFEITDNGRGIAERDYERVFELFRRSGDQSVPGEGIGLAHVRALVRRLGGNIDCRSVLDVGTTFTILLPTAPRPDRETPA
jgi:signal transduction histidine kinase